MTEAPAETCEDRVRLRGTDHIVYCRTPGEAWRVDRAGVERLIKSLADLGYQDVGDSRRIHAALCEYVCDLEYFAPGSVPGVASGLAHACALPQCLPGETAEVLGDRSYDRSWYGPKRDRPVLRDARCSLREIHQRIREDLRVDPRRVALRPLVATTENAARARWHYGVWGVYRRGSDDRPEAMVGVYGHLSGGFGSEVWHFIREARDRDWEDWRPRVSAFSSVRCAVTGRLLFEWGEPRNEQEELTADLFAGPPEMSGVCDLEEVVLASDPTKRPTLRVER